MERMSIALPDQRHARHAVVEMMKDKGIFLSPDRENEVMVVMGELFANCREHGDCDYVEVDVARKDREYVVVKIEAPCYKDPERTKDWLERSDQIIDLFKVRGRGSEIVKALSKVSVSPGSIDLAFKSPVVEQKLQLATA